MTIKQDDLHALTRIDQGAGIRHLLIHLALIVGCAVFTLVLHPVFLLPLGLCLGALFPLMHEASHRHIFHRPQPNKRLAFWTGAILLMSATWFRHFHQAHHLYTQDPAKDPELATPGPIPCGPICGIWAACPPGPAPLKP